MHNWVVTAIPWPGVRFVKCARCGQKARQIRREVAFDAVEEDGRPVASCFKQTEATRSRSSESPVLVSR